MLYDISILMQVAKLQQELSQQLEASFYNNCTMQQCGARKWNFAPQLQDKTTEEEVSTARKGSSEMASAGASKARAKQIRKGSEQNSRTGKDPKETEEMEEAAGEQKSQVRIQDLSFAACRFLQLRLAEVILLFLLVLVVAVGPYFFARLLD